MSVAKTFGSSLSLLWTRRFGTFWFSSLLANIGTWAQQIAEPWLLLSVGASSFLLGLDSFAMNAPAIVLTLAGGALADRSDRRVVIAVFQSIQMMCPTTLVILLLTGHVTPWIIVTLSLVVGITDALSMPSFKSIVPSIVPRDKLSPAYALNSAQFNLSRILGPTIAGVLMARVGPVGAFAVSAASFIPFIGVAVWILPKFVAREKGDSKKESHPLWKGFRAVLAEPTQRGALFTVFVSGAFSAPIVTFVPVLVRDVFHAGAGSYGVAIGSFGVGGLLGAFAVLAIPADRDRRKLCSWCAVAFGIFVMACARSPAFIVLPPLLVFAGMAMTASNIAANTALQSAAPPELLGRSASMFLLATRGGVSLGAVFTGATVGALGVRWALLLNGLIAVGAQLVIGRAWIRGAPPPTPPKKELRI